MLLSKLKKAGLLAVTLAVPPSGWLAQPALADAPVPAVVKPSNPGMTAEQFAQVHALLRSQQGESKGLDEIDWVPTLWEARQQAAAEGKMLFIYQTGGPPFGEC